MKKILLLSLLLRVILMLSGCDSGLTEEEIVREKIKTQLDNAEYFKKGDQCFLFVDREQHAGLLTEIKCENVGKPIEFIDVD